MNWQEKVIQEYDELTLRIQKLSTFIEKVKNCEIDIPEVKDYNLLRAQLNAMRAYQLILFERISNF